MEGPHAAHPTRAARRRAQAAFALLIIAAAPQAWAADVLVFTRTAGYRHPSIPAAVEAVAALAADAGLEAVATEDPAALSGGALAGVRAVVFAQTTGDALPPDAESALAAYVRGGGGFFGVHAAADAEYDWPWYGELVGAWFESHPRGLQESVVSFSAAAQSEGLPARWPVRDEFYSFRRNPRGVVEILATLDPSTFEGGRMGEDHPIAWRRCFDGGRTAYVGLGHRAELYADPTFRALLDLGLRFAAGLGPPCPAP